MFLVEVDVVRAPHALAPHLRRRDRAPPGLAARVHRAGHRVGARSGSMTLDYYYARMSAARAGRRNTLRRRADGAAVARNRASTGPGSATSGRASSGRARCRCATGRRRQDHVGQRLPPPRGATRTRHEHCASRSPESPPTRCTAMVGGNAAARLRLRPRRARTGRGSRRSERREPWRNRSRPATSPTTRCSCPAFASSRSAPTGGTKEDLTMGSPLRGTDEGRARRPGGHGHVGGRVVHVAHRDLRDRPRSRGRRCSHRRSNRPTSRSCG